MNAEIRFRLNGEDIVATGVDPTTTLLHWLRARGLTGSKEGCAEGECGACAVAWVSRAPDGSTRYEAVNGCLILMPSVHGRELVSVEGIACEGALHAVQREMAEGGGSQCGYCTPGFVVSLFAEYHRATRGPLDPEAIAGNLCRCTGYRPIRDAADRLAQIRSRELAPDAHRTRLAEAAPVEGPLSYAAQSNGTARSFHRPAKLSDALSLLARDPSLTVIGGGTDVVVEINQRHARHAGYLSLESLPELRRWEEHEDSLTIGAGVPLAEIEERLHHAPALRAKLAMLAELLPLFSSRLIRTRATLGGNLGTASPIGDSPPVLLAYDAHVVLASAARGERTVPLEGFFTGYRKTLREPDELIVAVRIPLAGPGAQRFFKVSKRVMDDISTVAGAFVIERDAGQVVRRARLAWGGVAATPVRTKSAEAALVGRTLDASAIEAAQRAALSELSPIDDQRGSARYRRAMVASLIAKLGAELGASGAHAEVAS